MSDGMQKKQEQEALHIPLPVPGRIPHGIVVMRGGMDTGW
jgi:hypothetical protein